MKNNLYFITNCVKNNVCCLGRVVHVGTGRDLSVPKMESHEESICGFQSDFHSDSHPKSDFNSTLYPEVHRNNEFEMVLNQYGLIVEKRIKWLSQQYPYVKIHNYKIMPNHFHFILEINDIEFNDVKVKSVSSLLGALKTTSSKLIHLDWFVDFEWHRSFHDHIIRDEKSYTNIFNYITNNPENWQKDKFYSKA